MDKNQGDKQSSKLRNILGQIFPFFDEDDDKDGAIVFEVGSSWNNVAEPDAADADKGTISTAGKDRDKLYVRRLPKERLARYNVYKEMIEDSTITAALDLHIAHALATDNKGGMAVYLHPKEEKHAELVAQLNREVLKPINEKMDSWIFPTAAFGCNYVRPYCEVGKGIVAWEANYYTLPDNIREYERSGQLAGFTSENMRTRQNGDEVRLAEPWALIPLKIPIWRPDMDIEPVNYSGKQYSLYDDIYSRYPIETQDYGTSMLHSAYESWEMLRNAIMSLASSRKNAALIDRLITINTDNLDTARAAEYINMVTAQLKQDKEAILRQSAKSGVKPTVLNTIIPTAGSGKGSVQIDTFTTDPNISHIEDIMFHLKRLAGVLGVDPAMLGFADLLSGGLGEGGFFRNSIQAAIRANVLRKAVTNFVMRAIDIHTAFKDSKIWLDDDVPFEIRFHSLNTAIATEEAAERESKANYATLVATVLDMIEQSPINNSPALKGHLYTNILELDPELTKKFIDELAKNAVQDDAMMESAGLSGKSDLEHYVRSVIFDVLSEFNTGD